MVGLGVLCVVLIGGCRAANPTDSGRTDASPTELAVATESPLASPAPTAATSHAVESDDPVSALTGRAVEALGAGGADVVLRIGAEGFRLPKGERLYDVDGDRVLSARPNPDRGPAWLVVRDLEGNLVREIATGMEIPQTGIVRGDDVYFGGINLGKDATVVELAIDRGVWVAHGDAPPAPILAAEAGVAVYSTIERSPDGGTVGIWRCGEICSTILIGPDGDIVELPKPGLIALTNEVALLIGQFNDVTAYAVDDGAELWRAETDGIYYERYATTDGERIVLSAFVHAGDTGTSTDQLRVELLDASTGTVERSVRVSTEEPFLWVEPSLSTDRYVAILNTVLPKAGEGPHAVQVIDLETGLLLDVELLLGDLPSE